MKYRYHWSFKLLALLLAVLSGAALILGAVGLVLGELGYYEQSHNGYLYRWAEGYCHTAADAVFDHFAWEGTGIEPKLFERFFRWGADVDAVDSLDYDYYYTIRRDHNAELVDTNHSGDMDADWYFGQTYNVRRGYVTVMPDAEYYPGYDQFLAATDGMVYADLTGQALPALGLGVKDYEYYVVSDDPNVNWQNVSMKSYNHADAQGADYTIYRIEYTGYESFYVEVGMTADQLAAVTGKNDDQGVAFLGRILADWGEACVPMMIWGGLVLALSCFWLALVAGKSPYSTELRPGGLNRLGLDLYLAIVAGGLILLVMLAVGLSEHMVWEDYYGAFEEEEGRLYFALFMAGIGLCGSGCALLVALFTMAASAQFKMRDRWWLKHSFLGMCFKWVVKAVKWCWRTLKNGLGAVARFFHRFVELLPLSWQWFLATVGLWLVSIVGIFLAYESWSAWPIILCALLTLAVVFYGAYCFGQLRDAAKKMSGGNLTEKIENKFLLGCFGEFAGHLNTLGDVCVESARQQMKSERMKTELITNVSHDIKTPLTSIINYVDLLRRTDDEAARAEYLAILDNQSQRLKKLIEDLMEMSRASSGNVAVEITPTDVGEALHQALGEFADRLEQRGLTVMTKIPAEPVMAQCDGRHLWRVLSNCLSNVVKYAMPGTRVYVDLERKAGIAEISLKNISAQTLNISSDELMERFVRGDASRNTEGNGLGLNIAKSLMEVQGGKLDLVVDGDLFKVILTLNAE